MPQPPAFALPLAFSRRLENRPPAVVLPLPFSRRLGEADGTEYVERYIAVGSDFTTTFKRSAKVANCGAVYASDTPLEITVSGSHGAATALAKCANNGVTTARFVVDCAPSRYRLFERLAGVYDSPVSNVLPLWWQDDVQCTRVYNLADCMRAETFAPLNFRIDTHWAFDPIDRLSYCLKAHAKPFHVALCMRETTPPARVVPGQFYPVPIPDPPPPPPLPYACGKKPEAYKLPLRFARRRIQHNAAMLPLPFACDNKNYTSVLTSYIMQNTFTATADGEVIQPLSASITTDMGSFCWQGQITLYPEDFAKLRFEERARGEEAEITIEINNETFKFLAEDYSDNREFGKRTYTVSGRSITARLSADYAQTRDGVVSSRLYARQLAAEQLDLLPFTITFWEMADWLIPENVYTINDKTPMAVLQDIAQAAGGFVESHPSRPQLSFKPRWKLPAWQLHAATPDAIVPDSVIASISGNRRVNPRFERVYVWAEHSQGVACDVHRQNVNLSKVAGSLTHTLYTDEPACRAAGIAALSDSGTHKIETVRIPISDEYDIPRAKLGQLWQFNEPNGYWRGIVQSVSVDVSRTSNGALEVWQTVGVDRYLDS